MTTDEAVKRITVARCRELLDYCPNTGVFTWKARPGKKGAIWNPRYAGTKAGSLKSSGYIEIFLDNAVYKAHRLAWMHFYGEMPAGQLDHINGCRSDNRISNLRIVTTAENAKNQRRRADNTSGVTGVVWFKRRRKWAAQISVQGKCKNLGCFESFEAAVRARKEAERAYGFHENHGRQL
ncbi:HNH endonuclease [Cupriavidus gilardii]|uniref:HNH endonuclease signature motif containing protein n=1 Tax=Cupriavidus gilardii TaxID=82541 RepID=UPI0021BE8DCE|nr:HNH endonuclease signature motif containing protein [Cupriavidus gilardii]MCT9071216.1 HNH endonuclease [Cupriavidus gilardii]